VALDWAISAERAEIADNRLREQKGFHEVHQR